MKKKSLLTISESPSKKLKTKKKQNESEENVFDATRVLGRPRSTSVFVKSARRQNSFPSSTEGLGNYLTIEDFTDDQWIEIRKCAQKVFDSKAFGGDQFRCAVRGFLNYLMQEDFELMVDEDNSSQLN